MPKQSKQSYVTGEGLKKLEAELEHLRTVKRKEIVETIKLALSFGDLSENSEYDEAKNEQAKTEARIAELEELLKNVKVVEEGDIKTDVVSIGSKVTVLNPATKKSVSYNVVGSAEADPFAFKISDESPMGQALMGAKKGDTVQFHSPSGTVQLKITEINK